MKSFEERKAYAEQATINMVDGATINFSCIECNTGVTKTGVPIEWLSILSPRSCSSFYVNWFSMCDTCRRAWELEALKRLPEIMAALGNA